MHHFNETNKKMKDTIKEVKKLNVKKRNNYFSYQMEWVHPLLKLYLLSKTMQFDDVSLCFILFKQLVVAV